MEEESYSYSFYVTLNLLLKGDRIPSTQMWKQPRAGKHKVSVGSSTECEELTKVTDPTAFTTQRLLDEGRNILGHSENHEFGAQN